MNRPAPADGRTVGTRTELTLEPVVTKAGLRSFIRFAWDVYANDPAWVPPLIHDIKLALDRTKHPFHRHAEVELFLARRRGRVVGRIAAILNRTHIEFHEERAGFFGLFECIDDDEVAATMLAHVEAWLRARGMETIRGPMNLSTNDELWSPGVLVDGFDRPPYVLMAHTPRYYAGLLERAGYIKAKDLLSLWIEGEQRERHTRLAERLMERGGFHMRKLDMKHLDHDVAIIQQIYNSAWERNWGFVPMSAEEITHLAKQLRPVVDPRYCIIVHANGEPAGFGLALPDFNQALKHINGRLLPFGVLKLLWHKRKIRNARVLTLGVTPPFRGKGLDALLILELFRALNAGGIFSGECSWILEDNTGMRNALERIGAYPYKTWRVYEKRLAS
jgi:hypothetical protein